MMQKRSLVGKNPNIPNLKGGETTIKHYGHLEENGAGDGSLP